VEELTLYAIDQEKRIAALEAALLKLPAGNCCPINFNLKN
jgi:hypothetical protein